MNILREGFNFYASENGESKDKLLLSLEGYGENLSKFPVIKEWEYKTESIFSIFCKIIELYDNLSKIPKNPQSLVCILEVAGKLIKCLCKKHRPYNILELGAEQGLLSYFLTYVATSFNEENMVHCVSGNLLNQEWMQFLQQYENTAENLNLYVTQPQTLSLQEDYFDFCVINSSEDFSNPDEVLKNAIRVLAAGSTLVFISQDGKIVEQKIALKEKQAAYAQSAEARINLQQGEMQTLAKHAETQIAKIGELTKEELCQLIKDLTYLERLAARLLDIDLKCKLNAAKENALNALYAPKS
jgi:ubiquinone/menaquinone biosynthesis C-methylase UbiE